MSRPSFSRNSAPAGAFVRVNGKIRAREVRVIGVDGKQLGVIPLGEAINMARIHGVDLVEVAPGATPPVCRLVDFGKYRYELAKREKDAKKHQHANRVKEVQLSPNIDAHDFSVKMDHAVDFLCEEMKVKITLKFRGREMAHQEFGFQVVNKFLSQIAPYGHPDSTPKLLGKGINVMISPLPRAKRAKHPRGLDLPPSAAETTFTEGDDDGQQEDIGDSTPPVQQALRAAPAPVKVQNSKPGADRGPGFVNNPFDQLEPKSEA